ncbi:hypothetical protein GCM10017691_04130 [Pseudonocardia petroleophila]|uniref:Integral membrane protein n=1 Tax=Pseudonocardia petroleophila TaxID=37331 RepID=A0A7G7MKM7_9PSEU|nr:hypothetical protein [Pseudonocardia petroleophila]QNG53338.1 hypothetical protein H6H00_04920 [Pseudonocardia petroleophila]
MDWYERVIVDSGRAAALWALLAFLVTFAVTRAVTRRIRARRVAGPSADGGGALADVHIAGVHVHHQVWGILLVLVAGLVEFRWDPGSPWTEVLAVGFGAGAALALDEFALWLHLDDVYWGADGRKSIDAVLVGGALGVSLLLQAAPVGPATDGGALGTVLYLLVVALHLVTAGVCVAKGKLATGVIGVVVPIVATVGALRLAKPGSVWARRRYGEPALARSRRRFGADYARRHDRIRDLIGGAPDDAAGGAVTPGPGRKDG